MKTERKKYRKKLNYPKILEIYINIIYLCPILLIVIRYKIMISERISSHLHSKTSITSL
jgi:hypothetical protein